MTLRRDPSKVLQVGFVGLLLILLVLASYWIYDHVRYTQSVRSQLTELYDSETDREEIAALDRDADMRINRILWEGGFFLVVLLGGLTVMTRTIRHDAELRRRQQNFLAAVSHEFKSPLASIRLAAETLALRSKEPEAARLSQRILADDDRLLRMVENLLDTTRLEEGRHTLKPVPLELAPLIATIAEAASERAAHAGIAINRDIDSDIHLTIDRTALEAILSNLLDNSLNACIAGSGKEIKIHARRLGSGVQLSVSDDGAGFPSEDAEMIFEKFYRAGDEMRRSTPGSGLGLYIVRRLVELSDASISARSDGPGHGAEFLITWPDTQ